MTRLNLKDLKAMFQEAQRQITLRADEFSKLDAVIGDGDHGTAILQSMNAALEVIDSKDDFKSVLNEMGFNVMLKTSGSTSTLLGGFLLGMSDSVSGNELNAEQVKQMFEGGVAGVKKQTKAQIGDKTMVDALYPAVQAMRMCTSEDIKEILNAAANAAQIGAEATVLMKANFGRARNYGEKSIGYRDSGATSWSCMLNSFANSIK